MMRVPSAGFQLLAVVTCLLVSGLLACEAPPPAPPSVMERSAAPSIPPSTLYYEVQPAQGPSQATTPTVVVLHGYGADEDDLKSLATAVLPNHRVVAVRAPLALPQGGYAWFPVVFGDVPHHDPADVAAPLEELRRLVAELTAGKDGASGPITLLGFSQGAAMALELALRHPWLADRVVAFSAPTPDALRAPLELGAELAALRVFLVHGDADRLLEVGHGRRTRKGLEELGVSVHYEELSGLGHAIDKRAIGALRGWLESN